MILDLNKVLIECIGEELFVSKSKLQSKSYFLDSMIDDDDPSLEYPKLRLILPVTQATQIVQFIEHGSAFLTSIKNACDLYILSEIYRIYEMENECRQYLVKNIKPQNVCTIHDFACKQNDTFMQYHSWISFDSSWEEVFSTEDFLRCKESTIRRFLSRPMYESLSEIELFKAVYKWADMQSRKRKETCTREELYCRIRMILEPFLDLIRFRAMNKEELENHVFKTNLLTNEEIKSILTPLSIETPLNLPSSICHSSKKRIKNLNLYESLFNYKNRIPLNKMRYSRLLVHQRIFVCEVFVSEDCFISKFELPIVHDGELKILLYGYVDTNSNPLQRQYLICKNDGKIDLLNPLFLPKETTTQLLLEILEEEFTKIIFLKNTAEGFEIKEREQFIDEIFKKLKYKYYFNLTLYF